MIVSIAVALILHIALFLVFPRIDTPDLRDFQAPLYVSFEPVPGDTPIDLPSDIPDEAQDPESPDLQEELGGAGAPDDATGELRESPPESAEESPPSQVGESTLSPVDNSPPAQSAQQEQPTQPEQPAQPAEPTRPPEGEVPDDTPSSEEVVPTPQPAPPPPPPRERSVDVARLAQGEREDTRWYEQQLEEIADIQDEYQRALEEWEARQEGDVITNREPADLSTDQQTETRRIRSFRDALSRMIEGIESADNVIRTTSEVASRDQSNVETPGTGPSSIEGVTVGDGSGQRHLVQGSPPNLEALQLPAGFPPEYVVVVDLSVGSDGSVRTATVRRPTPVPELDRIIEATVVSWRFESDPGSQLVSGSVTIVVDTRNGS